VSPEKLKYLYQLGEFNIKLGLANIREMLVRLGQPQRHPRLIHLAGTNGKGSTLAALEKMLLDSGYSTGSTISPHLISFNERFRLNGLPVDNRRLDALFERVCRQCDIHPEAAEIVSRDGRIRPTFFEWVTAMAFCLFQEEAVDYVLLETGLGGRLDATNAVESPIACVITRIAFDHQEFLGETLEAIADEKLGILKSGTPVFVAAQEDRILFHIQQVCRQRGISCFFAPQHFSHCRQPDNKTRFTFGGVGTKGEEESAETIELEEIGLRGDHQKDNLATALAVYHRVVPLSRRMNEATLAKSIRNLTWPGRLQYLDPGNQLLVDGAHNASGMQTLLAYLSTRHARDRMLFAITWMKGKNVSTVLPAFGGLNIVFIPVHLELARAESNEVIADGLVAAGLKVMETVTVTQLIDRWLRRDLPDHEVLVVAGSLYLTGAVMNEWQGRVSPAGVCG